MTTLDEAIKHTEKIAENKENLTKIYKALNEDRLFAEEEKCAEEYKQIAEWLKELKQLREQTRWVPVSKDLPPLEKSKIAKSDDVLVTDGNGVYIGYLVKREGKTSWRIYEDVNVDIIAWMHSPIKYEPQEREMQDKEIEQKEIER